MKNSENSASPIDNLLYDFISVLHNKAEGLQACEKYLRDAEERNSQSCIDMLNRVIEQDRQMVIELKEHLADMLQGGEQFAGTQAQQASAPH